MENLTSTITGSAPRWPTAGRRDRRTHQLPSTVAQVWSGRREAHGVGTPHPPQPSPLPAPCGTQRGREHRWPKNEWPSRDAQNTGPRPRSAPPPPAARRPPVCVGRAGSASWGRSRDGLALRRPSPRGPPETRTKRLSAGGLASVVSRPGCSYLTPPKPREPRPGPGARACPGGAAAAAAARATCGRHATG